MDIMCVILFLYRLLELARTQWLPLLGVLNPDALSGTCGAIQNISAQVP